MLEYRAERRIRQALARAEEQTATLRAAVDKQAAVIEVLKSSNLLDANDKAALAALEGVP